MKYVIVGSSAAGIAALKTIRRFDTDAKITCVTKQTVYPYNTCYLADYLSGDKTADQVRLVSDNFFEKHNIEMIYDSVVNRIDVEKQRVICDDGRVFVYDALLLAIGRVPRTFSFSPKKGIYLFSSWLDAYHIRSHIQRLSQARVVIIGAGLSGLECADALSRYTCTISVVDYAHQLLLKHLDESGARYLQQAAQDQGIMFYLQQTVAEIKTYDGAVRGIYLTNGDYLSADIVVYALGSESQKSLFRSSGVIHTDDGIITDEYLRTSVENLYAAGDVAIVKDRVTGHERASSLWSDALQQGTCAAMHMMGYKKPYAGSLSIVSSAFFGMKFFSYYQNRITSCCTEKISIHADGYKKILFEGDKVKGFMLVGPHVKISLFKQALMTQIPFVAPF